MKYTKIFLCVSVLLSALALFFSIKQPKIAYVNTSKLVVGFAESAQAERAVKAEEEKLQANLKMLEDSVKAKVELMSKDYNSATAARKKELQDLLTAENQRYNNYKYAGYKQLDELRAKKLQAAMDKANVYMQEYGKKHRYSIVFATASGNIVYGNQNGFDITDKVIAGLNERYK